MKVHTSPLCPDLQLQPKWLKQETQGSVIPPYALLNSHWLKVVSFLVKIVGISGARSPDETRVTSTPGKRRATSAALTNEGIHMFLCLGPSLGGLE
jgi:hypothetical protein